MYIERLKIENIRGFSNYKNEIGVAKNINVFVGPNNSGKSTILKSIHLLQASGRRDDNKEFDAEDVAIRSTKGVIEISINDPTQLWVKPRIERNRHNTTHSTLGKYTYTINRDENGNSAIITELFANGLKSVPPLFRNFEKEILIYPYLSKRKVINYSHSIAEGMTDSITGDLSTLYGRIDKLIKPGLSTYEEYVQACTDIFGKDFIIYTKSVGDGKKAGLMISEAESIFIDRMGEGTPQLLGLITYLCFAKDKIFLIEEMENDIHPTALKALLKLIERKSANNQFFISTHSNIVVRYLGSITNSKVFNTTFRQESRIPKTTVEEVPNNEHDRLNVLEELGYEPSDYGFWKGYLFLEEASAEAIIREFLIPVFTPKLANVIKTFSAKGKDGVLGKFDDFNRLFVFLHLEPTYKNKVWVIIDGGKEEAEIIDKLKSMYVKTDGWNEKHFSQFLEHYFEKYYPEKYKDDVKLVLGIADKRARQANKIDLTRKVLGWSMINESEAKAEWAKSAKEVIEKLKEIEKQLLKS